MTMTKKEKREYLNLLTIYKGKPFAAEVAKKDDFLNKIPKKLFKFRNFDDFTFDMLENNYVYLAPAEKLDDPFDCLTNVNPERVYRKGSFELSDYIIKAIIDTVSEHAANQSLDTKELIRIFKDCSKGESIDTKVLINELEQYQTLNDEQKEIFYEVISNFPKVISTITEAEEMKKLFIALKDAQKTMGVCSLTTKRDNKVMWSLYGNTYKGYCVEYEEINDIKILQCLKPVIYSKRFDNDIIITMIRFCIETMIRAFTYGQVPTYIGAFDELLCTKDSDWSFQDEWRIIDSASSKKSIKTKAVYLGFDVTPENQEKMVQCAKHNGFSLFKMKAPKTTKKIEYDKLA